MPTRIPVVTPAQIDQLAGLARSIWQEHFPSIIGQAQVDYMLATLQSAAAIGEQVAAGQCYFLCVDDAGELCGYLSLLPRDGMLLSKLYLTAASRGRGLGRWLLEQAIADARAEGHVRLWLTVNRQNHATIAWYRRRGFRTVREQVQDIGGGFVMDDYVMELSLTI